MAQGLDSTKTPARPSHEAIEGRGSEDDLETGKADQHKLDQVAMRGAKRAENRILDDEGKIPGSSIFTK
jgi:hypothetical protein